MKSVDRLREWASDFTELYKSNDRQLNEIADAIEAEVAERYVELPTDRNDRPVRVGDTVYGEDGHRWRVTYIRLGRNHSVRATDNTVSKALRPEWLTHEKPPTVEDVLREFADVVERNWRGEPSEADIATYAAKLRLAEGGDAS